MKAPAARQEVIVGLLRNQGRLTVEALATALATSHETIRRDLAALALARRVRKFHGGASLLEPVRDEGVVEGSFQARMTENVEQKRRVGRAAAAFFRPGDSIFIDTGTTTVFFAEELGRLSGLTIITNSTMVAQQAGRSGQNRIFLIGGEYRESSAQSVGRLAVEAIRELKAAHAVITVGALDVDGALDFDAEETAVARAMIEQSRTLTVVADGSKLERPAVFKVCELARIERLVIDVAPSPALRRALDAAGVATIVAD